MLHDACIGGFESFVEGFLEKISEENKEILGWENVEGYSVLDVAIIF